MHTKTSRKVQLSVFLTLLIAFAHGVFNEAVASAPVGEYIYPGSMCVAANQTYQPDISYGVGGAWNTNTDEEIEMICPIPRYETPTYYISTAWMYLRDHSADYEFSCYVYNNSPVYQTTYYRSGELTTPSRDSQYGYKVSFPTGNMHYDYTDGYSYIWCEVPRYDDGASGIFNYAINLALDV